MLWKIFKYLLFSGRYERDRIKKVRKAYKIITNILNSLEKSSYAIVEKNNTLYLKYNSSYSFTKKYALGRLYSVKSSINQKLKIIINRKNT